MRTHQDVTTDLVAAHEVRMSQFHHTGCDCDCHFDLDMDFHSGIESDVHSDFRFLSESGLVSEKKKKIIANLLLMQKQHRTQ